MSSQSPSKTACNKAIKCLTQYKRLAQKYGVNLPPKRLEALDRLREAKLITLNHLPATLHREFPKGAFGNITLAEILDLCGK